MIRILAIGNSFSEDAMAYLHPLSRADDISLECVNLMIGGCSLQRHCENAEQNAQEYAYQKNGENTGKQVSIKEALLEYWDFITVQQASHDSGFCNTYYPFTEILLNYIRSFQPKTPIYLHQTWAYEVQSTHSEFVRYHHSQNEMYYALEKAYHRIHKEFSLPVIPSGEVIQNLRKLPFFDYSGGGKSLCRDGFHMEEVYGRYAVAATWYRKLLKADLYQNHYLPPGNPESKIIEHIKDVIMNMVL